MQAPPRDNERLSGITNSSLDQKPCFSSTPCTQQPTRMSKTDRYFAFFGCPLRTGQRCIILRNHAPYRIVTVLGHSLAPSNTSGYIIGLWRCVYSSQQAKPLQLSTLSAKTLRPQMYHRRPTVIEPQTMIHQPNYPAQTRCSILPLSQH